MIRPTARLRARWAGADADVRRFTRSVTIAAVASLLAYVTVLWDFALNPLRAAFGDASFSNFYDVQGRALLHGHLSLPEGELGIEAFVQRGREYMYFPPGPSLLRAPVLAVTDAFDGRLTAPSMLAAHVITVVLIALLLWRVRRILRGRAPLGWVESAGYGVLLATSACGSVLLFLASMPFIYHEAYAWAIALSLGAAFCTLGLIEQPTRRSLVGASLCTLGAILCRTTAGWACAGALVLTALWYLVRRPASTPPRWVPSMLVAAAVPLAVGIAFNWAKFRHPYMFPLDDQIWTGVNEQRRLALAANGGDLVSFKIFPSTAVNYFRPDGIRFTSLFPWITLPARPAPSYGGSFLDQSYRTGSVVDFMPLLFILSAWGLVTAFRPKGARGASAMRIPLLGMLAISGAIMFYGYIAFRYTSELVPALVLASAIGFTDLFRRIERRPLGWRRIAAASMLALALFGFLANLAVAVGTSRINNPGRPLTQLVRIQEELSDRTPGRPFDGYIATAPELPAEGEADHIQIVGDCAAVFVGTGDPLWPWMPLEARELAWDVDASQWAGVAHDGPDAITLAKADGWPGKGVVLHLEDGTFRATFDTGTEVLGRRARPLPTDGVIHLRLVVDLKLMQYVVVDVDNPRRGLVDIESSLPTPDWFRQQLVFRSQILEPTAPVAGITIRPVETPPLGHCAQLRERST